MHGQRVSAQGNKELARQLVEDAVRGRSLEALDEIAAGHFAEVATRWVAPFRGAFPDFEMGDRDADRGGREGRGPFQVLGIALR